MNSKKNILFATTVWLTGNILSFGQVPVAIASTTTLTASPLQRQSNAAPTKSQNRLQPSGTSIAIQQEAEAGVCASALAYEIDRIIQQPIYDTARWGIKVELISPNTTLYSLNSNGFLIPASNIKLLTTAAALQMLPYGDTKALEELDEEIERINRKSDNDYADDLLDRIGGAETVQRNLSALGIEPNSYRQVDGSGLSRDNYTTAGTLVKLLKAMFFAKERNRFYASLPVSGVSGTLQKRFVNTVVQGRLMAKTGTLQGVRALSGYLEHPTYGVIVFSIIVNQDNQGDTLRRGIDQIVLKIGQLKRC